jgi:lipoteichoic acid synthase
MAPHDTPTGQNNRWKSFFTSRGAALFFLCGFVICNAFKIAAFNQIIVSSSANSIPLAGLLPATLVKIAFFAFFFVLLVRLGYRLAFIVFYLVQIVYIYVNLQYYLSFQGYLHINQYIGLFSEAFDLLTHSAMPWDIRSLFVLADLPFFIGMTVCYPRLHALIRQFLFKPVFYGFSVFFIIYFYFWDMPFETPLQMMNDPYSSDVSVVKKYGLLTYNIVDLFNYRDARMQVRRFSYGPVFTTARAGDGPRDTTVAGDTAQSRDTVAAKDSAVSRDTARHPNILIVQVESLDAYIVNYRHGKRFVTPYLHGLAKKSLYFPYTLSYHAGGSTSDCEFSTLNSVEPLHNYPSIKLRNYDYRNSLVTRLTRHGYNALAFHGNRGTYFNRNFAFKKIGFQKFYDMYAMGIKEKGWGLPDDTVFSFSMSRLTAQKEPCFYHIITMSSHEPFTLIKPFFQDKQFDNIRDGAKRNYFNSIAYVDKELKRLITFVRKTSPNTVIFIYGDHTPTLPKCGYKKATIRQNDRVLEFVPLFILTPERTVYNEKKYAASFLDIAPTILAASGIQDSIRTNGQNLLDLPIKNKEIPLRGQMYSRKQLYSMIAKKR